MLASLLSGFLFLMTRFHMLRLRLSISFLFLFLPGFISGTKYAMNMWSLRVPFSSMAGLWVLRLFSNWVCSEMREVPGVASVFEMLMRTFSFSSFLVVAKGVLGFYSLSLKLFVSSFLCDCKSSLWGFAISSLCEANIFLFLVSSPYDLGISCYFDFYALVYAIPV